MWIGLTHSHALELRFIKKNAKSVHIPCENTKSSFNNIQVEASTGFIKSYRWKLEQPIYRYTMLYQISWSLNCSKHNHVHSLIHPCCRNLKRRKIEEMNRSSTIDELLNLVGRGRIDITCATDIARAVMKDGVCNERVEKLSSLGNWGLSQSNCERDLHTWLRNLFGLRIQPYTIYVDLKAWGSFVKKGEVLTKTSCKLFPSEHIRTYFCL